MSPGVLRCPRCGRTRAQDTQLWLDGIHCSNCAALVQVTQEPDVMGRIKTTDGRP